MAEKEKFHCHEAPNSVATEEYCLEECKSTQRGVKAECPESVNLLSRDKKLLKEIQDLEVLGKRLKIKPGHRTHKSAKERWGRRGTKL